MAATMMTVASSRPVMRPRDQRGIRIYVITRVTNEESTNRMLYPMITQNHAL